MVTNQWLQPRKGTKVLTFHTPAPVAPPPTMVRLSIRVPQVTTRLREPNPPEGGQEAPEGVPATPLAPSLAKPAQPMPAPRPVAPSLVAPPAPAKRTAVRAAKPVVAEDIEAIVNEISDIVRAKPTKVAGSSVTLNAERRIEWLQGQIANDCASLAHIANSVGTRIREGATPRQDGEVGALARQIDQNCASLFELLRLVRCYG